MPRGCIGTQAILRRFGAHRTNYSHRDQNMTKALFAGVLSLAALLHVISSHAAESPKGDPKAGHALVYTCGGCHGVPGYANAYPHYHVPRIAGQNYDYLVAALTEYKKGERAHPTMR